MLEMRASEENVFDAGSVHATSLQDQDPPSPRVCPGGLQGAIAQTGHAERTRDECELSRHTDARSIRLGLRRRGVTSYWQGTRRCRVFTSAAMRTALASRTPNEFPQELYPYRLCSMPWRGRVRPIRTGPGESVKGPHFFAQFIDKYGEKLCLQIIYKLIYARAGGRILKLEKRKQTLLGGRISTPALAQELREVEGRVLRSWRG
jgi:hypothetical protein